MPTRAAPNPLQVVGDQHNCLALTVQVREQRHDCVSGFRVEVSGGLVCPNDRRAVDQRAGNGHPLLLAARQLIGSMSSPAGQPH